MASDVALRAIDSVARIGDLSEVRALVLHIHIRLVRLGSLELLGRAIVAAGLADGVPQSRSLELVRVAHRRTVLEGAGLVGARC